MASQRSDSQDLAQLAPSSSVGSSCTFYSLPSFWLLLPACVLEVLIRFTINTQKANRKVKPLEQTRLMRSPRSE